MEKYCCAYLFIISLVCGSCVCSEDRTEETSGTPTTATTSTKKTPPSLPNCTETTGRIYMIEGDMESRLIVNCDNLGISDANIEAVLRRISANPAALSLAHNHLENFNLNLLKPFRDLKLVNLSDNKITMVTGKQKEWPSTVEVVDFSNNKLGHVAPNMIPTRARRMLFSNNAIAYLKNGSFTGMSGGPSSLIHIDLSHNKMRKIFDDNNGVLNTPLLNSLNLSYNSLSSFFSDERKPMVAFSRLDNLELLDLSFNDIDRIFAGDMQFLGKLRHLNLSHNDLPDLDAFSFNALSLKKNGHPYMWQHWAYRWWLLPGPGLRALRTLDLSFNHIRQIDLQLIHEFGKLDSVDLSNNWYNCDGEMFFATGIMKKHVFVNATFININSPDYYTCFTPLELSGQHIYNFNCSDFCLQTYNELQRRFDAHRGYSNNEEEDLTGPSIAMIVAASIFLIISLLAFLWALRNGLIHRCCHVCLTRLSTSPPRNSRSNQSGMTARFAQLDQLEAETEVA